MDPIRLQRLGHWLYKRRVPLLPQAVDLVMFLLFGSYFRHPIDVGEGTTLNKVAGVIIHSETKIGRNVSISPRCVITGRSGQRPPTIEDGAFIGIGSMVLGDVTIGRNATVGAGAVVTFDVPPGRAAVGNPARLLPEKNPLSE